MSKVKKIIIVFFSFITILSLILSVPVSAEELDVYTVQYQKPIVDKYSGYLEILTNDNTVFVYSYCMVYNTVSLNETYYDEIDVVPRFIQTGNGSIDIYLSLPNSYFDNLQLISNLFNSVYGNNYSRILFGNDTDVISANIINNDSGIKAVRSYGKNELILLNANPIYNWTVTYGSDTSLYYKMQGIKEALQISNQGVIDNANQNASQIQQNQDDNTDKIIENQQQIQENEKNEAETQGQGSVDEIGSAIEDKSAGFISAIGSLVNSMSYNGTACAWSFPALKLPAIEGVMAEYQLTEEQPIDFEFWVNKIPSDILLLVRSLLTIALIVYCFKELYSTISYVLTLKGGGNSE